MQVTHIKISNILGIESLEIEAGKFTTVSGMNGTGKTSVIEAIQACLKGGHDATLLRKGADKGEVVLVLDDGSQVSKRVTAAKSEQLCIDAQGRKSTRPAESIKALVDALSVNPIEFLTVPKKQQVAALLEAMPMKVDAEKLGNLAGVVIDQHTAELHAIDAIEVVRKMVYDERTGLNRAQKEKANTVKQMTEALPDVPAVDAPDEADLRQELSDLDAALQAELTRIDTKLEVIQAAYDKGVADLRAQIDEATEELNKNKLLAAEKKAAVRNKSGELKADINNKLSLIDAAREQVARAEGARETIRTMTSEAESLLAQAQGCTAALEAIEEYKSSLLSSLPIPGLEVRDGEIYADGIVFDRLNEAQKVRIAVELAKLRAGALGLVCVDGIERLDPVAFEAFREQAIDSGLQMVVSRVTAEPFTVESES